MDLDLLEFGLLLAAVFLSMAVLLLTIFVGSLLPESTRSFLSERLAKIGSTFGQTDFTWNRLIVPFTGFLMLPIFVGTVKIYQHGAPLLIGLVGLIAVSTPLVYHLWIRNVKKRLKTHVARAELLLNELSDGPLIKHPELDAAILSSRVSLARTKENLNSGFASDKPKSTRLIFLESLISGSVIVTLHAVFLLMYSRPLNPVDLSFRICFVVGFVFITGKWGNRPKVRPETQT